MSQEKMDFVETFTKYFALLKQKPSKNYFRNTLGNKNSKNQNKKEIKNSIFLKLDSKHF